MVTQGFHALTLVCRRQEHDGVHTFRFEADDPVAFQPGQYVHLLAPQSPPGKENVRHLSIASIPSDDLLQFTFDLSSGSDYKKKFAGLEPGGRAHLFKVKGEFVLPPAADRPLVFLAGGLGITPIRSLVRQLAHQGVTEGWRLAHVARGPHLFEDELKALGGLQERLGRPGVEDLVDRWTDEVPGALWYLAGSEGFVSGVGDLLKARGVSPDQLRVENFH